MARGGLCTYRLLHCVFVGLLLQNVRSTLEHAARRRSFIYPFARFCFSSSSPLLLFLSSIFLAFPSIIIIIIIPSLLPSFLCLYVCMYRSLFLIIYNNIIIIYYIVCVCVCAYVRARTREEHDGPRHKKERPKIAALKCYPKNQSNVKT